MSKSIAALVSTVVIVAILLIAWARCVPCPKCGSKFTGRSPLVHSEEHDYTYMKCLRCNNSWDRQVSTP